MKTPIGRALAASLGLLLLAAGVCAKADDQRPVACARIVSLAPSIDEVVFKLGLGAQLVGVTRFSFYPEAAKTINRVGGFLDVNREAIVSLRPTLVIALTEHGEVIESLKALGLRVQVVSHKSVRGILHSISDIAETCGLVEQGRETIARLSNQVAAIEKLQQVPPLRVMIALGDDSGEGPSRAVYISGRDGFYSQLLRILGAENVHEGTTMSVPSLSAEGLIALDPDAVVVVSSSRLSSAERELVLKSWYEVPGLRAVKSKDIYVLDQDFMTIPGPRYVEALAALATVLREAEKKRNRQ